MNKKIKLEGFGAIIEFAESLGWIDTYGDDAQGTWSPKEADNCEEDAINTLNQKAMKLNALSGSVHNERITKLRCCLLALRILRHSIRACDYLTTNHLTAPF